MTKPRYEDGRPYNRGMHVDSAALARAAEWHRERQGERAVERAREALCGCGPRAVLGGTYMGQRACVRCGKLA